MHYMDRKYLTGIIQYDSIVNELKEVQGSVLHTLVVFKNYEW